MAKLPRDIIEKLLEARKAATLENASFGWPNDEVTALHRQEGKVMNMHPTDYIKDRVRLHHQSWIIHPIDVVLEWAGIAPPENVT